MTAAGPPPPADARIRDGHGDRARAPFPRELLAGDVDAAAERLLGAFLVREPSDDAPADGSPRERRVGRIVEVEAYGGPEDAASHARFERSRRRASMAAPPGSAYVYLVYGMHTCLNVVTGPAGSPAAVLVRAVAPVEGIGALRRARASGSRDPARIDRIPDVRLAAGPALVAASFGVDRSFDGSDLCSPDGELRLEIAVDAAGRHLAVEPGRIRRGPRIGVTYAGEPWASLARRLRLASEPAVSRQGD